MTLPLKTSAHWKVVILQGELEQERQKHEAALAAMKEEETLRVDRMAHDLEVKWTENLRYIFLFCNVILSDVQKLVFFILWLILSHCLRCSSSTFNEFFPWLEVERLDFVGCFFFFAWAQITFFWFCFLEYKAGRVLTWSQRTYLFEYLFCHW